MYSTLLTIQPIIYEIETITRTISRNLIYLIVFPIILFFIFDTGSGIVLTILKQLNNEKGATKGKKHKLLSAGQDVGSSSKSTAISIPNIVFS
ncbi:unnamed protein product [Candida verbasci]|uniref:Uncharacterized protein n=1 Tax=Candida verbasci TaxID=1227364 RepID=A0A9W4XG29_9ASCO|nr:unnamed protein product [Candida verbasci]